MLNVFTLASGRLFQEEIESLNELAHVQPVWVDLEQPTPEEKGWIAQHFGVTIPEDAVDDDLEESARFYEEDSGELHIRSDFLIDDGEAPRNVRVAFILFNGAAMAGVFRGGGRAVAFTASRPGWRVSAARRRGWREKCGRR